MRRSLLSPILLSALTISTVVSAQDKFAFAITDQSKTGAGWNVLRKIDLSNGTVSEVLLNGSDAKVAVYDFSSKKKMTMTPDARYGEMMNVPFGTGVAAAAYDKKHNRLYYTPMFVDQLRYIDLSNMKVYYVTGKTFSNAGNMVNDDGKIITRMVIAPDGFGYAISNDGNTFVKFSTNKKAEIQQLGALVDDPANARISVHNKCTSYGGDMISDDEGNLFIISARNQVFKVNVETKVATHVGGISDLPQSFTVNGAVVNAEGTLLVSSATDGSSYYAVDPAKWSASPVQLPETWRASDLANSNYLSSRQPKPELANVELIPREDLKFSKLISVYPNPVTTDNVTLQFNKVPAGDYIVQLTDNVGRIIMSNRVVINNETQTHTMRISKGAARGQYMVRVVDRANTGVFNQKVIVQ